MVRTTKFHLDLGKVRAARSQSDFNSAISFIQFQKNTCAITGTHHIDMMHCRLDSFESISIISHSKLICNRKSLCRFLSRGIGFVLLRDDVGIVPYLDSLIAACGAIGERGESFDIKDVPLWMSQPIDYLFSLIPIWKDYPKSQR